MATNWIIQNADGEYEDATGLSIAFNENEWVIGINKILEVFDIIMPIIKNKELINAIKEFAYEAEVAQIYVEGELDNII